MLDSHLIALLFCSIWDKSEHQAPASECLTVHLLVSLHFSTYSVRGRYAHWHAIGMCLWFHVSLRESWICVAPFHKEIYLPKSSAVQICDKGPLHEPLVSVVAIQLFCRSPSCSYCRVSGMAKEFARQNAQIRVPWSQILMVRKALRGLRFERVPPKIQMVTVWQSWGLEHSQIKASWMWLRPLQKWLLVQHPL